jgi:hypothetical protein
MMVSVLRRLRTRTGLSLIAGICLMLALFLVNLLGGRYLPLERLSWILALIGTDLAVLIVAVQLGRGFFAPEAGRVVVEVGNGRRRACPPGLSVELRQPPDNVCQGRDELISRLRAVLTGGSADGNRVHVLAGPFGAGKTRIAQEIAHRARKQNIEVWWIPSAGELTFKCAMCAVARSLDAPPDRLAIDGGNADFIYRQLARRHGFKKHRWLLVIDGADDLDVLGTAGEMVDGTGWIREPDPSGMVIVTTMDASPARWNGRIVDHHVVGRLDAESAARVLRRAAGDPGGEFGAARDAQRLAERLGRLPLALRLVGKYFAQLRRAADAGVDPGSLPRSYSRYLSELDVRAAPTRVGSMSALEEADRRNLGIAWDVSLSLLERQGFAAARPLLGLLGEIGADNEVRDSLIQPQLFEENGRAFQPLADAAVRDSTLARLVDFGLLERRRSGRSTVWNVPPATRELVRADPRMDRVRADVLALRREILGSADRDRSNPSTEARTRAVSLQLSRRRAARGGNRAAGGGNRGAGGRSRGAGGGNRSGGGV